MIDIYADVIDNYGDMAFAINLIIELQRDSDIPVRLFSNKRDIFELFLINIKKPHLLVYRDISLLRLTPPNSRIWNLFDKKIPYDFLESYDYKIQVINFSYFLLHQQKNLFQPSVSSLHKKEIYKSKNLGVISCIVSLLPGTGGVNIHRIPENQEKIRNNILKRLGLQQMSLTQKRWVSVFAYPETLEKIQKQDLCARGENIFFILGKHELSGENIITLPFQSLENYRELLSICDLNIVRGENSLVDAILAGKPFLWDIYKENNKAEKEKIEDFVEFLQSFHWDPLYFNSLRGLNSEILREDIFQEKFFQKHDFEKLQNYTLKNCNLYKNLKQNFM